MNKFKKAASFILSLTFLISVVSTGLIAHASGEYITYYSNNFSTDSYLTKSLQASYSSGIANLVSGANQTGSLFFANKIREKTGFSTFFKFALPNQTGNGGDGFTFVISSKTKTANTGAKMGYASITNSIGIEFDTVNNNTGKAWEQSNSHIAIYTNGNNQDDTVPLAYNNLNDNIFSSSSPFYCWIEYDNVNKRMFIRLSTTSSRPSSATLSCNIDLSTYAGSEYYAGFTASSGNSDYQTVSLSEWSFDNKYYSGGLTAGNSYTKSSKPATPTVSIDNNTATFLVSNKDNSLIDYYEISTDLSNWTKVYSNSVYLPTYQVGDYSLAVRAIDIAGNVGTSYVSDVSITTDSTIDPMSITYDKNATLSQNVEVTLTAEDASFVALKLGSATLTPNVDYVNNDNVFTIYQSYLNTLPLGTNNIVFDMSNGGDPILSVNVINTPRDFDLDVKKYTKTDNTTDNTKIRAKISGIVYSDSIQIWCYYPVYVNDQTEYKWKLVKGFNDSNATDADGYFIIDVSESAGVPDAKMNFKVLARVKNGENMVYQASKSITLKNPLLIAGLTVNGNSIENETYYSYVNQSLQLAITEDSENLDGLTKNYAILYNGTGNDDINNSISVGGKKQNGFASLSSSKTASWTPSLSGKYTVKAVIYATDSNSKVVEYVEKSYQIIVQPNTVDYMEINENSDYFSSNRIVAGSDFEVNFKYHIFGSITPSAKVSLSEPGRSSFKTVTITGLDNAETKKASNHLKTSNAINMPLPGVYQVTSKAINTKSSQSNTEDTMIRYITVSRPAGQGNPLVVNLSVSKNGTPETGTTFEKNVLYTYTATCTGGSGVYEYSYWRTDASGSRLIKDWSTDNQLNWSPAKSGKYQISVRVRQYYSNANLRAQASYEATAAHTCTVAGAAYVGNPVLTFDKISGDTAIMRSPITISANADTNPGTEVLYKYEIYNTKSLGVLFAGASPQNTCIWTPLMEGMYTIKVTAIDADSFGMDGSTTTQSFIVQPLE